jgi:peptide deformylase
MPKLSIITAPDPRLKLASAPVETVDDALRRLMDGMLVAMYDAPGIGLSAIQVGVARQVIVADCSRDDEARQPLFLVNPKLVWHSDEGVVMNEGCLSLPEHFAEIERPERVRVEFLDYHGKPQSLETDGLLSRCIQHEHDHLDGTLFVDRISALKRNMILRKLVKAQRQKAIA